MSSPAARLFHTVVVVGASLAGCGPSPEPTTPAPVPVTGSEAAGGGQPPADAAPPADAGTPADAGSDAPPTPAASNACPPGSERPFPPCYWIL